MMKMARYSNVFDALEDDPAVAENLKIRAQLMHDLRDYIQDNELTQSKAAALFGVDQPRVSDLVRGKIDKFTIDMLVSMLVKAGKHVDVRITDQAA